MTSAARSRPSSSPRAVRPRPPHRRTPWSSSTGRTSTPGRLPQGGPAHRGDFTGVVLECAQGSGPIHTKSRFGDVQLHVEWAAPDPPHGKGQDRGNSGIFLMGRSTSYRSSTHTGPTPTPTIGQCHLRPIPATRERLATSRRMAILRRLLPPAPLQQERQPSSSPPASPSSTTASSSRTTRNSFGRTSWLEKVSP